MPDLEPLRCARTGKNARFSAQSRDKTISTAVL
jgi:hypothetical protein